MDTHVPHDKVAPAPDVPPRMSRRSRRRVREPGGWRWLQHLNVRQSRVLFAAGTIFALVLLVPPWLHEYHTEAGDVVLEFAGYRPAFMPPAPSSTFNLHRTRVDGAMLLVEVVGVCALTTGAMRSMSDRLRYPNHHPHPTKSGKASS